MTMTRHTPQRAGRAAAIVLLLTIAAASSVFAQSTRIGPARPGGDPSSISNTSFPFQTSNFYQGGGAVQYGSILIAAASGGNTSSNMTVLNSAFVGVTWRGQNAGNDGGNDACEPDQRGYLTLNVINATTVSVSATRTGTGNACGGAITLTMYFGIYDVSPTLANSVQHGTATGAGTNVVITSVSTTKAVIENMGSTSNAVGAKSQARVSIVDATHMNANADIAGGSTVGWQIIDWK